MAKYKILFPNINVTLFSQLISKLHKLTLNIKIETSRSNLHF